MKVICDQFAFSNASKEEFWNTDPCLDFLMKNWLTNLLGPTGTDVIRKIRKRNWLGVSSLGS